MRLGPRLFFAAQTGEDIVANALKHFFGPISWWAVSFFAAQGGFRHIRNGRSTRGRGTGRPARFSTSSSVPGRPTSRAALHPLTGSSEWVEYAGSSVVRKIWDGRGKSGGNSTLPASAGHIEGLSLRLYNPQSRQWNITWANSNDGALTSGPWWVDF